MVSRDQAIAAGRKIDAAADMGSLLKERRKKLGYTQEQVASSLGYSPRLVGEIERGRGTVGFDRVVNYATSLGLDIAAFER